MALDQKYKDATCLACGNLKPCMVSNIGMICSDCFKKQMQGSHDSLSARMLGVPPPSDATGFFMIETHEDGKWSFITMDGVLYAFNRKEDAEWMLKKLAKETGLGVIGVEVAEKPAMVAFLYAMTAKLKMTAVMEVKDESRTM